MYFPYDMSVKSNFTFDLIFLIHEDSEYIGLHFSYFTVQNRSRMKMTDNLENLPKTMYPSFMISRWVSTILTKTWLPQISTSSKLYEQMASVVGMKAQKLPCASRFKGAFTHT